MASRPLLRNLLIEFIVFGADFVSGLFGLATFVGEFVLGDQRPDRRSPLVPSRLFSSSELHVNFLACQSAFADFYLGIRSTGAQDQSPSIMFEKTVMVWASFYL